MIISCKSDVMKGKCFLPVSNFEISSFLQFYVAIRGTVQDEGPLTGGGGVILQIYIVHSVKIEALILLSLGSKETFLVHRNALCK